MPDMNKGSIHPLCDPGRLHPFIKKTLDDYGKHGLPPGDFLLAVLRNDLLGAYARADHDSIATFAAIIHYVRAQLPVGSYGSAAAVDMWIETHFRARHGARPGAV